MRVGLSYELEEEQGRRSYFYLLIGFLRIPKKYTRYLTPLKVFKHYSPSDP